MLSGAPLMKAAKWAMVFGGMLLVHGHASLHQRTHVRAHTHTHSHTLSQSLTHSRASLSTSTQGGGKGGFAHTHAMQELQLRGVWTC